MTIFDTILLIALVGFIFYGFFFGLVRTLGLLIGVFAAALIASHIYVPIFNLIHGIFFGYNNLGQIVVFTVLFIIIIKLVELLVNLLETAFNIISIIPFLKTINRLLGAVLGFFAGCLVIGLFLYILSKYAYTSDFLSNAMINSKMVPLFIKVNNIMLPLLPNYIKSLNSVFNYPNESN